MNTENTNIAEKILAGSANIDRMRKEIQLLVSLIMGYVRKCYPVPSGPGDAIISIRPRYGSWAILGQMSRKDPAQYAFEVKYFAKGGVSIIYIYSEYFDDKIVIPTEEVRLIHSSLNFFVEGVLDAFPKVMEEWKPLMEAS